MAAGLFAGSQATHNSDHVLAQAAQEVGRRYSGGPANSANIHTILRAFASASHKNSLAVGDAPFTPGDVFHGIAPEFFDRRVAENPSLSWYEAFPTKWYELRMQLTVQQIIPKVRTPLFGYDGTYPGPTFRARVGQPVVVRAYNDLSIENSIHLHGGHNPSHSDGFPNFYVLPGRARDYYYTNSVPS